jgi:hypothetical protein
VHPNTHHTYTRDFVSHPNGTAKLPRPLQRLPSARNRTAAPVKLSDWFAEDFFCNR